jgi:hypothetical protein
MGRFPVQHADVAVVLNGYDKAIDSAFLPYKRGWLKGVKTVFVTDVPLEHSASAARTHGSKDWRSVQDEVYFHTPHPASEQQTLAFFQYPNAAGMIAGLREATRRHVPPAGASAQWVFVSDADTYFNLPRTLQVLSFLDPSRPYFLGMVHPEAAGRCIEGAMPAMQKRGLMNCCPNLFEVHGLGGGGGAGGGGAASGLLSARQRAASVEECTCSGHSLEAALHTEPAVCPVRHRQPSTDGANEVYPWVWIGNHRRNESEKYYPFTHTWAYGGAGMIFSAGLLRALPPGALTECIERLVCEGTDRRLTGCLLKYGFGVSHLDGLGAGDVHAALAAHRQQPEALSFHHMTGELAERLFALED